MRRFSGISAALFACVASCGDDGNNHQNHQDAAVDSAVTDAHADAAPDATPTGDVTVTTYTRNIEGSNAAGPHTPVADVPVVVLLPDGSVGSAGTTDGSGNITFHGIPEGASVTAAYPTTNNTTDIVTTLGVKPGDHLQYGDGYFEQDNDDTDGTVTLTAPAVIGATSYIAQTPCGEASFNTSGSGSGSSGAPTLDIDVSPSCQAASAPIGLYAYDDSGNVISSGYLPAAAFMPDSTPALATWTANTVNDVTVTVTGLGSEVDNTNLEAAAELPFFDGYDLTANLAPAAGSASTQLTVPLAYPRLSAHVELYREGNFGEIDINSVAATSATSVAVTQPGLPWVSFPEATSTAIEWLQTTGTYTGALFNANWSRPQDDAPAQNYSWNIIIPPGETQIALPPTPAALAAFLPTASDEMFTEVDLIDLASAHDYDDFRATPEWILEDGADAVRYGDEATAEVSSADGGEGADIRTTRSRKRPGAHDRRHEHAAAAPHASVFPALFPTSFFVTRKP